MGSPMNTTDPIIKELLDLVRFQKEYIAAIPEAARASFPAMPGFDGDWADTVIRRAELSVEPERWAELAGQCLTAMNSVVDWRMTGVGRPPEQTCMSEMIAIEKALAQHSISKFED